ncbi:unnamed protein product [Lactuca virosa]|uniref:Uncharacterized protein n=1 Tax=Lactuca virosa TaxID=75947 RepID=A0AAU9MV67_9ASTR|nr:unnamed protein product [Lactuca virosa]
MRGSDEIVCAYVKSELKSTPYIGDDGDGSDFGKNVGGGGACDNSKAMRGGGWIHFIEMMKGINDLGGGGDDGEHWWLTVGGSLPSTLFLGGGRSSDGGVVPWKKAMVTNTMVGGWTWLSDLFFGEVLGGSLWGFYVGNKGSHLVWILSTIVAGSELR